MEAKMALGNRASWNVATVAFVRRWKTRNVPDASLYTDCQAKHWKEHRKDCKGRVEEQSLCIIRSDTDNTITRTATEACKYHHYHSPSRVL
jgi:hypothetical protein